MRPTKLTPEIQETIVNAVKLGNYIETAAALAGIHKSTLYDWMKRGAREAERLDKTPSAKPRKKELPYLEFSDALTRALAYAESRDVEMIDKAAIEDWRASAWRLERRNSERWGKKDKVTADLSHSGKDGGPIETNSKFDLSNLSDEELQLLAGIIFQEPESEDS